MVSLGCSKNLVDSERILNSFLSLGCQIVEGAGEADILVVNTCSFIEAATKEALENLFYLSSQKKEGAFLVVIGCLVSRYGRKFSQHFVEADLFVPPGQYQNLPALVASLMGRESALIDEPFENWPRSLATPPWRAWLKISEGCNRNCAYCLIPSIRGPYKPKSLERLKYEASLLVSSGVKEITMVAQDLTAWHEGELKFGDLVQSLAELEGLVWLRLMYAYPDDLTEKLVKRLAICGGALIPYLDMPLQHASASLLRRMNRKAISPLKLVKSIRDWWPEAALRSTLMVGFPGETESEFEQMLKLVEEAKFENLGVFKFSPEEGARAAKLPDQIPASIKEKRRRTLMAKQRAISKAINKKRIGSTLTVLVEGASEDSPLVMVGRATFQAPEVDGLIYFDGQQPKAGQIVEVKIIKSSDYDLVGRVNYPSLKQGACKSQG
jgi:ribosomal protein S12 methylthiotransferase RimO